MSQARAIGLFFRTITGGSAMTRPNHVFMLRRAYEHLIAGAGALVLTALVLFSVETHAAPPRTSLKPSVTILVPTVTIEAVDDTTNQGVAE
jgi:hypothetical protein